MTERVETIQDVYDLIIATCQDDPEFHAWGASALRYLNAYERQMADLASADTHRNGGDAKQAPLVSGAVGSEADETPR